MSSNLSIKFGIKPLSLLRVSGRKILLLKIDHDVDYGVDGRTGYSVCINGRWVVQFEPRLLPTLWRAWRAYRSWEEE